MHFFLRLIVSKKISDSFDIEFKYPKIVQATRLVQPSFLCNLFSYLICLVILHALFTRLKFQIMWVQKSPLYGPQKIHYLFDSIQFQLRNTPHRVPVCLIPFNLIFLEK